MKIIAIIFTLMLFIGNAKAQYVKKIQDGKFVGVSFLTNDLIEYKQLKGNFEDIAVFVHFSINGVYLGESYTSCNLLNDTEFLEVPFDVNDPSKTKVETIITETKSFNPTKPILVKKGGRWGFVNEDGAEMMPCEYEEYLQYSNGAWNNIGSDRKPLILMTRGVESKLVDAQLQPIISESQFPAYFSGLKRKGDALELCFFGDYILVNQGGSIYDSLIKVPAVKEVVKGKTVVKEKAYSYTTYVYKGGKFNVINLQSGLPLWPVAKTNIQVKFKDQEGKEYFESLNPRSLKSISTYEENLRLGITPAQIEFVGE
ncbi:MAG: hypothetical protein SGJ00_11410 [bacterium]|nr:hypothetical protein [bacterium]